MDNTVDLEDKRELSSFLRMLAQDVKRDGVTITGISGIVSHHGYGYGPWLPKIVKKEEHPESRAIYRSIRIAWKEEKEMPSC